ncbi:protein VACUOLELESS GAMETOPHYTES-like [Rutidosis leptorrhynchoides]|uniref:protein VACUOLELESS GAMETOPHYTES-like n=1 Tax=Rutidosis leptorrhynchoides TaxID=125765 RepID=UPI003A99C644
MEEIDHLSHKQHPLKLIENWDTVEGIDADVINCDGCQEPVSISLGEPAYGCIPCNYFWHKTCAQLPSTFTHHFHPFHALALTHTNLRTFWSCEVCNNKHLFKGFTYRCDPCDFDACIKCVVAAIADEAVAVALKEEASIKFKHEGHHPQHTLTLQLRSATFRCDACQTEEKDNLYHCDDCDFWIHKTCAHLPQLSI